MSTELVDGFLSSPPVAGPREWQPSSTANGRQAAPHGSPRGWPEPLAVPAYHGLAGEFVRQVTPYTEADPVALLASFLTAFGSAVGRGPHMKVGATRHPARIFTALVGRSSKARKGDSWVPVRVVFGAADAAWGYRVQQGLSTGEGLIAAVRDRLEKPDPKTGELAVIDEGIEDKRLLAYTPELVRLLRVMGRDGNTLSAVVREAFDGDELQVMTKTATRATGAHISVVGHVTADELKRELLETDAANGFANRFSWLLVRRGHELPDPPAFEGRVVSELASKVAVALSKARGVDLVRRDPETSILWKGIYHDLSRERPGLAGAILGRHEALAVRLQLIYALLDGSDIVRPEHLEAAIAVMDYVEASVTYIFGDALGDSVADRIRDALIESGEMTRTDIWNLLGRHFTQGRLDAALELLAERGFAHRQMRETSGRHSEVWVRD